MPVDPNLIDLLTASGDPQAREVARAMVQQLRRDKLRGMINMGGGKRQAMLGKELSGDADATEKGMLAAGIANQRYGAEMKQHQERMAAEKQRNDLMREQIRQMGGLARAQAVGARRTGGMTEYQIGNRVDKLKKDLLPAMEAKDDIDRLTASVEQAKRTKANIPGMTPWNALVPDMAFELPIVKDFLGGEEGVENRQIARRLATNLVIMKHGKRYTAQTVKDMQKAYGISPLSSPTAVAKGIEKMKRDVEDYTRFVSGAQPDVVREQFIEQTQGADLTPGLDPKSPLAGPRKKSADEYLEE